MDNCKWLMKQQWLQLTLNDEMIIIVFEIILILDEKIAMIAIDWWSNIDCWNKVDCNWLIIQTLSDTIIMKIC